MALWVDEMDAANKQDMADRAEMHDIREAIRSFRDRAPARARQATLDALGAAERALEHDIRHVEAVWD